MASMLYFFVRAHASTTASCAPSGVSACEAIPQPHFPTQNHSPVLASRSPSGVSTDPRSRQTGILSTGPHTPVCILESARRARWDSDSEALVVSDKVFGLPLDPIFYVWEQANELLVADLCVLAVDVHVVCWTEPHGLGVLIRATRSMLDMMLI